jgi:hypothetical protein
MPLLADYHEQCGAFTALLQPTCQANILLFSGASGSGKTTLVNACLDKVPAHVTSIPIQMRGSATTVPEIFRRVGEKRAWRKMNNFIAALQTIPQVLVDTNRLIGIGNQINVALDAPPADRDQRRATLTHAWFDDLRALDDLLLIALDTYEDATPEVQQWIAGPFLACAVEIPSLRILIAGQKVPNPHNIEWGSCCTHHELYGVPEAEHWLPVIEAMGRYIPVDPPETWLAGVCHALKGAPKDIMQVIEGLPSKEVVA